MNILVWDCEASNLARSVRMLEKICPRGKTEGFTDKDRMLGYLKKSKSNVVFLSLYRHNTQEVFSFARMLSKSIKSLNIIFIADDNACGGDALDLRASGYMVRPLDEDKFRFEINDLRYPPL